MGVREYEKLRETGDGLRFHPEAPGDAVNLSEEVKQKVAGFIPKYHNFGSFPDVVKRCIILIELAATFISADWSSELSKVKIMLALFDGELRAHEAGGFARTNGSWQKTECVLRQPQIDVLEQTTRSTMVLLQVAEDSDHCLDQGRKRICHSSKKLCEDQ